MMILIGIIIAIFLTGTCFESRPTKPNDRVVFRQSLYQRYTQGMVPQMLHLVDLYDLFSIRRRWR